MQQNSGNSAVGTLLFILGVVFVVLKVTGTVTWPWIWVLAPFWIGLAIWAVFTVIALIVLGLFFRNYN